MDALGQAQRREEPEDAIDRRPTEPESARWTVLEIAQVTLGTLGATAWPATITPSRTLSAYAVTGFFGLVSCLSREEAFKFFLGRVGTGETLLTRLRADRRQTELRPAPASHPATPLSRSATSGAGAASGSGGRHRRWLPLLQVGGQSVLSWAGRSRMSHHCRRNVTPQHQHEPGHVGVVHGRSVASRCWPWHWVGAVLPDAASASQEIYASLAGMVMVCSHRAHHGVVGSKLIISRSLEMFGVSDAMSPYRCGGP